MTLSERLVLALKALRELGLEQVSLYAYYQLALRSGWLRRMTPPQEPKDYLDSQAYEISLGLVKALTRDALAEYTGERASALLAEANELQHGKVRLFGGPPQEFDLVVPLPLEHWTRIRLDQSKAGVEDIKYLWEPARFTWMYTLARAYILSGDESYVEVFWQYFEAFMDINLPNLGPNWVSAQEVALRLIAFAFACQVLCRAEASTPERINRLSIAIVDHAARIPSSLAYARAQNNNHLLSEAAGLITAGVAIPGHPQAEKWRRLGWRWFNHGLEDQITSSGTYTQHSTNYHRLLLQLALWVTSLESQLSPTSEERLAAATNWLLSMIEPGTGRMPNLGHNDGSYFQPLSSCSYADYRPVLQAAALRFLGERPFPQGRWDELPAWLGLLDANKTSAHNEVEAEEFISVETYPGAHLILRSASNPSWGMLRAAYFRSRPAHADQLHLDLWWQGHNIAIDPGTYLYNSEPPWNNSLIHTHVHNTVTIAGKSQMTCGGRFLWLDWAQAEIIAIEDSLKDGEFRVAVQHDGYRKLGLTHRRTIKCLPPGDWIVEDELFEIGGRAPQRRTPDQAQGSAAANASRLNLARLHWLLPDWSWEIDETTGKNEIEFRLRSPEGWIKLVVGIESATGTLKPQVHLIRAGEYLHGEPDSAEVSGWVSPTYGYKIPALSLAFEVESAAPVKFTSQWEFPPQE